VAWFRTQGIRVIGKIVSTVAMSFKPKMAMFRQRSATGPKIHRGKLIKVTIGLTEPMRESDMIRCLLMSQRTRRIYNDIQKSSR
jgi:hypothetical protein